MNTFFDGVERLLTVATAAIQVDTSLSDPPITKAELQALGQTAPVQSSEAWIRLHYELIKEHAYCRARRGLHTLNFPLEVSKERPAAYIKKGTCAVGDIIPIVELLKKKFHGAKIWTDTYQEDTNCLIVINMDWSAM